jgi:hypothetical protein
MKRIFSVFAAAAWLAGAAALAVKGAVSVDVSIVSPVFSMSNTVARGYEAAAQSLQIVNSDPGLTMYYRITNSAPWVKADPSAGLATGNVIAVTYSTAALNAGTSNALLTVVGTNNLATKWTTNTVSITLVVQPAAILGCNGTDLQAQIRQGQTPAATSFGVWNASSAAEMSWTAASDASWVTVSPSSGSSRGETDTITVQFNTASLSKGQYTGHITVHGVDVATGEEALQSPRLLTVSLTVLETKPLDFFGDATVSDLVVYQESTGNWYILRLADRAQLVEWIGGPGYAPAPGDFTGDGRTDLGVYRAGSGTWYLREVTNDWITVLGTWGNQWYEPVPGDYDGDGKTDFMVYQESAGFWYLKRSSNGQVVSGQFGGPGFRPHPGDYDGDGVADAAIYDELTGRWYIITVSGVVIAWDLLWGGDGYTPVTGDFDGDRHTDLGAYHEGSGLWFLADIAGNVIGWWISWGGPGYQPVAKDYNGDERAELAVYQSTTGLWYIRTVGGTILEYGLTWGGPGYTPVP